MVVRVFRGVTIILCLISAACSRPSSNAQQDLSQAQGTQIRLAMASGAVSLLPDCSKMACSPSKVQLLHAAALRIDGKLEMSMRAARQCFVSSRDEFVVHYTCARLINMEAKDIGGLYGEASTIDDLADATRTLYKRHTFGARSDFDSSYMGIRRMELDGLKLVPERVVYDDSIGSLGLFGYERSNRFIGEQSKASGAAAYVYPSAKVVVNGRSLIFRIDTGAQVSSLTATAARRVKVLPIGTLRDSVKSLAGNDVKVGVGIADTFGFANVTLFNKSIEIVPDDAADPGDPGDGILGWDVLRKMPAFEFAGNTLEINPDMPKTCDGVVSLSSDINTGGVLGIVTNGSVFNGVPAVTVFDSGNAIAGILPTPQLVRRQSLQITDPRDMNIGVAGGYARIHSGSVVGTLKYLGVDYSGPMTVGANFPGMPIDFDVGLPLFFGKNVYIDLGKMKMCTL